MFITIKASNSIQNPPKWALLERELIDKINNAVPLVSQKYTKLDGTLFWPTSPDFQSIDGLDDCYESFHNWPLFYMLGGDSEILSHSHREFNVITEYMAQYQTGYGYPMVVKEYQPSYDWFHQSEGNYLFYMLCMADPDNSRSVERSKRFAEFFTGDNPDVQNYDPKYKIIKCARNGSKAPAFWTFPDRPFYPWDGYNMPFYDIPGCINHEAVRQNPELVRN